MNEVITNLLDKKKIIEDKLNSIPYIGTIEIKEINDQKYLYVRNRVLNKITSKYVGVYSDELYSTLLNDNKNAKALKKELKAINKELVALGYSENEDVNNLVLRNIDYAKREMKNTIYDQAILEGIATTFADTSTIIDNGIVNNMKLEDIIKINNLKRAWLFILDLNVISSKSDYYVLSMINKFINDGIYYSAGKIRSVPVRITGCNYVPPLLIEEDVKNEVNSLINENDDDVTNAIYLALYVMKTQVFDDGNKRTGIIFANHYLISKGKGLLVIPFELVSEFQKLLVDYYDDKSNEVITFLKEKCYKKI